MSIIEYKTVAGHSPYAKWLDTLEPQTRQRVDVRVRACLVDPNMMRLHGRKLSGTPIGEIKYRRKNVELRAYFAHWREGFILLGGSGKDDQQRAIDNAHANFKDWASREGRTGRTDHPRRNGRGRPRGVGGGD